MRIFGIQTSVSAYFLRFAKNQFNQNKVNLLNLFDKNFNGEATCTHFVKLNIHQGAEKSKFGTNNVLF